MALWHWIAGGAAAYWLLSKKDDSQYMTGGGNLTTQQAQAAANEAEQIRAAYQAYADKLWGAGSIVVTVNPTAGGVQVLYNNKLQETFSSLAEAKAAIAKMMATVTGQAGYGYRGW